MKKFLVLFVSMMLMSISLNAFEPIRISITSTPNTTANLVVDVLNSDGTTKLAIITSTSMTTDASGVLSVILNNNAWTSSYGSTTYPYLASDLLRITFNSVVLSIERMEVVISKQSLYGATISPDEIDQTENFTFKKIGILESGTTPTYYTYLQGGEQDSDITYSLPIDDGTSGQVLSTNGTGTLSWVAASGSGSYWTLSGNSGTTPGTNFIGTTDDKALVFKVNNAKAGELSSGTNTSFGYQTLFSNDANTRSTAIGYNAMYYADDRTTGQETFNTAVGYQALYGSTTASANIGQKNTAVGDQALYRNTSGSYNTANGTQSLFRNTSGNANTANGTYALDSNTTGGANTGIGCNALHYNVSGGYNTACGHYALYMNKTGNYNTAVGYLADANADNYTNYTVIGATTTATASNQVRLGDEYITTMFCMGAYKGTSSNSVNMVVDANGQIMRSTSSARYKNNIEDITINTGNIYNLRPVSFISKIDGKEYFGLIAEEVAKVLPELAEYARAKDVIPGSNSEELIPDAVKYPMLSVLLLNELKKQKAEILAQKDMNEKLLKLIEDLQKRIDNLEEIAEK